MKFGFYLNKLFPKNDFSTFNTWQDRAIFMYKQILNNNKFNDMDIMYDEETVNSIMFILDNKLSELYEYELIFEEESLYMDVRLKTILSYAFFKICNQLKKWIKLSSKDLEKNISVNEDFTLNTQSFEGFSPLNTDVMDGNFSNNTSKSNSYNFNLYQFFSIVDKFTGEVGDETVKKIKTELLQVVY